jgi:hypothetical protein
MALVLIARALRQLTDAGVPSQLVVDEQEPCRWYARLVSVGATDPHVVAEGVSMQEAMLKLGQALEDDEAAHGPWYNDAPLKPLDPEAARRADRCDPNDR